MLKKKTVLRRLGRGRCDVRVKVVENVLKLNDEVAAMNRRAFGEAGLFVIDLIGAPGCGKTALLEQTVRRLAGELRVGIVVGDLATTRDAERLINAGATAVQINTGRGCHLDANQVRQAIGELDLSELDVLVIENVGNLICPVGFDLGQDVKVGMFSVSEGDDKAAKHPHLVHAAGLLILNKMDLMGVVPFEKSVFVEDVKQLNDACPLVEVSVTGDEIDGWLNWIREHAGKAVEARH